MDKQAGTTHDGIYMPARGTLILVPSLAASVAACDTLFSLLRRLPANDLLKALPSYPQTTENRYTTPDRALNDGDEDDMADSSFAKTVSRCFIDQKNCWRVLVEGFALPLEPTVRTLPGSPSKRHRNYATRSLRHNEKTGSIVGSNAWPVLDWLIQLFAKDERETFNNTGGSFTCILVCAT
jgi:hypothetical protein